MKGNKKVFEVYLNSKHVTKESWYKFMQSVSKFIGYFKTWEIVMLHNNSDIRYYIVADIDLPTTIYDLEDFLIRKVDENLLITYTNAFCYMNDISDNFADIIDKEETKYQNTVKRLDIKIRALSEDKFFTKSYIYFERDKELYRKRLFITVPQILLSIDFVKNSKYFYKKYISYLDIQKTQHLFYTDAKNALLKVDAFPYLQGNYYLKQSSYDFDKHSMVVGSSGSGKSKMISLFVNNLYEDVKARDKYKVVIIDPHAALEKDIGGLDNSKVLNFERLETSINLFANDSKNVVSSTEMIMAILRSLIGDNYNAKLERVLRYSVHLLVMCGKFNFKNLRKLLLNTEYRSIYLKDASEIIPVSISEFFLTEYTDLKTKYYNEAISPIISFIDEMELLPAFSTSDEVNKDLKSVIDDNFLTLLSLNRVAIGDKGVKSISSLIMQQLMQIIQARQNNEHIILIVDEVSVVENPILMNFLSEARKYNLSLILAQQYFNQISQELQSAIFANVLNYYIFRVSRSDAAILANNISIKMPKKDTLEDKVDMLVNLNNRECIARVCEDGVILPALKGKTMDYISNPLKEIIYVEDKKINIDFKDEGKGKKFELGGDVNLFDLLLNQSSSRKDIRGESV